MRRTTAVAIAGWLTTITLASSCGTGPADRVLADLEQRRPAGDIVVDAEAIENYAPVACAKMREVKAGTGLTIEQFSSFLTSAPPGTFAWLPVQGLTDGQLTDLNRAVAAAYCADALP